MAQVSFYYDVVCPYSYLETRAVEAAVRAGELEVEWLPFELRPAPRPLLAVGPPLRSNDQFELWRIRWPARLRQITDASSQALVEP